jgi:hypothetical protein
VGSCERGNKSLDSIQGEEFLHHLSNHYFSRGRLFHGDKRIAVLHELEGNGKEWSCPISSHYTFYKGN